MAESLSGKGCPLFRCKYCATAYAKPEELIAHKKGSHLIEIIAEKKLKYRNTAKIKSEVNLSIQVTTSSMLSSNSMQNSPPDYIENEVKAEVITDDTSDPESGQEGIEVADGESEVDSELVQDSEFLINPNESEEVNGPFFSSVKADNDGFQCPMCHSMFNYDYQLAHHITTHGSHTESNGDTRIHNTSQFQNLLSIRQPSRINYRHGALMFQKMRTNSKKRSYKCKSCKYTCKFKYLLTHHELKHGPINKFNNLSNEAGSGLTVGINNQNLQVVLNEPISIHHVVMEQGYSVNEEHVCNICHKICSSARSLYYHILTVHQRKFHKCEFCPYKSAVSQNVKMHVARLHGDNPGNKFPCPYCSAKCFSKHYLEGHIHLVHKGKMGELGTVSGASTSQQMSTQINKSTERPRARNKNKICSYCPFSSDQRKHIDRHINNVHLQTHQHKCQFCTASYKFLTHLYVHELLHQGSKNTILKSPNLPKTPVKKKILLKIKVSPRASISPPKNDVSGENIKEMMSELDPLSTPTTQFNSPIKIKDADFSKFESSSGKFTCQICDQEYGRIPELERHYGSKLHIYNTFAVETVAAGGIPEPTSAVRNRNCLCSFCYIVFTDRAKLAYHMDKRHSSPTIKKKKVESTSSGIKQKILFKKEPPKIPEASTHEPSMRTKTEPRASDEGGSNKKSNQPFGLGTSSQDEFKTNSSVKNNNATVTVTHEKSFGLKITTVRFGK